MFGELRRMSVLGLSLMIGQAFLYSATLFAYALVLTSFFKDPSGGTGYHLVVFAVGNVLGPLTPGLETVTKPLSASS